MTDIGEGRTELPSELCISRKLRRQESHIQGTPVFKDINKDPSAKTSSKNCKRVNMQTGVNKDIKEAFYTNVRADEQTYKSGNKVFQLQRTKKRHLAVSDEQHANFEERLPRRRKQQERGEGKIEWRRPKRQETALKTGVCDDTEDRYSSRYSKRRSTAEDTTETPTNNNTTSTNKTTAVWTSREKITKRSRGS